jgi:hypothetical protein
VEWAGERRPLFRWSIVLAFSFYGTAGWPDERKA